MQSVNIHLQISTMSWSYSHLAVFSIVELSNSDISSDGTKHSHWVLTLIAGSNTLEKEITKVDKSNKGHQTVYPSHTLHLSSTSPIPCHGSVLGWKV